jgi:predicted 3-demethylubiquinone-9 3-methyltransferase (glyoxalase superfamily)
VTYTSPRRPATPKITRNLWFDDQALEAAEFCLSVLPNSEIRAVARYTEAGPGEPGTVLTVDLVLDGNEVTATTEVRCHVQRGDSLLINCKDQADIDYCAAARVRPSHPDVTVLGSREVT